MAEDANNNPESIFEFWPLFGDSSVFVEFECDNVVVATDVLDTFGIPYNGQKGGTLGNLDIKHMDAYQAMKLSLMEASADDGAIYEAYTNADGEVEFVPIGTFNGLQNADIYYEIQTGTFVEECSGVMVTGGRPLVERRAVDWTPIWQDGYKQVFDTGFIASSCMAQRYNQYSTIVFQDPHIRTGVGVGHKDGIDNLYETKDPWENILGYVRRISWPGQKESPDTTVTRSSQSKIPIEVSKGTNGYTANIGTLQKRPAMPDNLLEEYRECFNESGDLAAASNGILIPLPAEFRYEDQRGTQVDHLINISAVYVVGRKVDNLVTVPTSDAAAAKTNPEEKDAEIVLSINESRDKTYKLSEGEHFQIAYEGQPGQEVPYVVFADNSREKEVGTFGTNVEVIIDSNCRYYTEAGLTPETSKQTLSVLPTSKLQGYIVKQVIAVAELSVPSITVFDPLVEVTDEGGQTSYVSKARTIANNLTYELTPLITYEPPAPIAFNGTLLDQAAAVQDHDPTTQQDFSDTDLEKAIDQMDHGGGLNLNFSFLDEEQIIELSDTLYEYMNSRDGSITTYVCGPDSEPALGGYGPDSTSTVNEIAYSYSDSNSYTISVTCGPKLVGDLAQIGNEITYKMTEEVSARGTVIEDLGNNIHYKVQIDGYNRVMTAINCTPEVIRVGDKLNVTVHNNPVEA